jgi:hypothetical protein
MKLTEIEYVTRLMAPSARRMELTLAVYQIVAIGNAALRRRAELQKEEAQP